MLVTTLSGLLLPGICCLATSQLGTRFSRLILCKKDRRLIDTDAFSMQWYSQLLLRLGAVDRANIHTHSSTTCDHVRTTARLL